MQSAVTIPKKEKKPASLECFFSSLRFKGRVTDMPHGSKLKQNALISMHLFTKPSFNSSQNSLGDVLQVFEARTGF